MMPVAPQPAPPDFDTRVRTPGQRWLASHPDVQPSKLRDYWNEVREEVQEAFDGRCAYLGLFINSGQIDHFIAKAQDKSRAYDWENFRWAEPRVNGLKRGRLFLDPFTLQPGWVRVDPATLEFAVTASLPAEMAEAAWNTIEILNDPELVRGRRYYLRSFLTNGSRWNIEALQIAFPLLAEAVAALEGEPAEMM